mmetsp:Transcript_3909/g.5131  ORF Transcript_3909/g.5131 Transcript_3909/m.5131 type:complete len:180 (+) Transcript_3909:235-774(+)|eukprot:CAMPEP_0198140968 /NCGR_PEP_ID=MMETSP1443-20131203/4048_1 /TAXON_ID=186043 /ORGANISM="Entomoneis sp., Strain CCMP2396" /LENGTH=179 /DNA_ID=CAMNT_0043803557 /DNA_START=121 /DNA_END=660 /DNA_ORIENTATION=+
MSSSDEAKKALIIWAQRVNMASLCSKAGTQEPLLFLLPHADGTGSFTAIWESEAAAVKTLHLAFGGGNMALMAYEQKKRFVVDAVVKCWQHQGRVNYTIVQEGISPRTAKGSLTFPTYRQLLDAMFADAQQLQQQQQQMQQVQQTLQSTEQGIRSAMQATGAAPTHYVNGVPHYGGVNF